MNLMDTIADEVIFLAKTFVLAVSSIQAIWIVYYFNVVAFPDLYIMTSNVIIVDNYILFHLLTAKM